MQITGVQPYQKNKQQSFGAITFKLDSLANAPKTKAIINKAIKNNAFAIGPLSEGETLYYIMTRKNSQLEKNIISQLKILNSAKDINSISAKEARAGINEYNLNGIALSQQNPQILRANA